MRKRLPIYIAVAALVVGVWFFWRLSAFSARGGEETPLYSSQRYDPYGTAALRELLKERGVRVETLDTARLDPSRSGVLIQTSYVFDDRESGNDFFIRTGQVQTDSMMQWIEKGNTVLIMSRGETNLERAFKKMIFGEEEIGEEKKSAAIQNRQNDLQRDEFEAKNPERTFAPTVEARWLMKEFRDREDILPLTLKDPRVIMRFGDPMKATGKYSMGFLAATEEDEVVAMIIRYGKGRLIIVGAPTPALNDGIGLGGNLDFMLWVIGDGPVIFDEWSHGQRKYGTVMGVIKQTGLLPVVIQIIFVIALYVWSTMGAPPENDEDIPRRRSSLEQIETLGWLYGQSLAPAESLARVRAEALRRMGAAMRSRPADVARNIASLSPKWNKEAKDILNLIKDAPVHTAGHVGNKFDATLAHILNLSMEFEEGVKRERKHSK